MVRNRVGISGIFVRAIVFLLLCGIVCGEMPELLTLTDNTSNDFAIRMTNSVISPLLRNASRRDRVTDAVEFKITAHDMLFLDFYSFERAAFSSDALIFGTVLRR